MEADWSVELGAGDAAIVVPWVADELSGALESGSTAPRYIELRGSAQCSLIDDIPETRERPALRNALETLNQEGSHLWTTKCDAWEAGPAPGDSHVEADGVVADVAADIDPWEMDASPEEAIYSAGSYIDLLLSEDRARASFELQEQWVRALIEALRQLPLRCARTDLVLRGAEVDGASGFGVTWFTEGCGATPEDAHRKWAGALAAALPILMDAQWLHGSLRNATIAESLGE